MRGVYCTPQREDPRSRERISDRAPPGSQPERAPQPPPTVRPPRRGAETFADWNCPSCGALNFERRRECFKCGGAAPALPDAYDDACDEPSAWVVVRRLDECVRESHLTATLSQFGALERAEVLRNPRSGISRGFAFVKFASEAAAQAAVAARDVEVYGQARKGEVRFRRSGEQAAGGAVAQKAREAAAIGAAMAAYSTATAQAGDDDGIGGYSAAAAAGLAAGASGGTATAAGGEDSASDTASPASGFGYDPATGYYKDAASGMYFDANTQLFYDPKSAAWYAWDAAKGEYVTPTTAAGGASDAGGKPVSKKSAVIGAAPQLNGEGLIEVARQAGAFKQELGRTAPYDKPARRSKHTARREAQREARMEERATARALAPRQPKQQAHAQQAAPAVAFARGSTANVQGGTVFGFDDESA